MRGYIITKGDKAITINDKHDRQYRASLDTIDINIVEKLSQGYLNIKVFFKVDKSISYGKSSRGKRYEAYDVNSCGPYGQMHKYLFQHRIKKPYGQIHKYLFQHRIIKKKNILQ